MSRLGTLATVVACASMLSACGGGRRGSERAKVAVVKIQARANPAAVQAPAGDPRKIEARIYQKKYELRAFYYGLERQTLLGWINDWKGYDAETRRRIQATTMDLRALATELKVAAIVAKSDSYLREADLLTQQTNRLLGRMSRFDRQESALKDIGPLFRR